MVALGEAGKIGAIGLSGVDLDGLKRAIPADIACVQNAWVPFFPLGGAHYPEWPKVTDQLKVIQIAARLGVTSSQLGLAWLIAYKPNILLIPGTASIGHLEENIASASISLDSDVLDELDAEYADAI